ncbi:TolC family protein [Flavivirga aquimarina]|uniref:TolC family protein n=1 Tax=Flavivirga aquimarina TaxID=2027862 RepID=A0ABT8WGD9_9FLAO|nr:TolC family protein [Flavivirga aquimarina]MDO5972181.1 TolC family protein [Flavivirga aquimarina]
MSIKSLLSISMMSFMVSVSAQEILSVSKAIELALENNYGIKIASNNNRIAENNKSILNTGYLPTLTGNAGATYNLDNTDAEFSDGSSTTLSGAESSRYNASLDLNYTLFDGLGRHYDYKQLKETYQLSKLEARETIENTMAQLFTVYYNVARISENVNTLQQTLAISKDRIVRAQYQFDYGQSTKLDVLNAQVDINNDSINLINAKQELKNAKRDLNVVLGNSFTPEFKVDTLINFMMDIDKNDLFNKMKTNNVTLLQLDKNIMINEFTIKANKSGYLPTVGLTGSYGWNKNNNNAASFLAVSTNTGFSGGITFSWDLFDGGSTITTVKNAKINLENQQLEKESIFISIERDFDNAWDDYQNKLAIYRVQEDNIITSQNNFDRTQENFKLGQVTSIEFRQAQLNLLNSELSRDQAKYEAKLSELNLLQLSGELLNVSF